MGCSLSLSLSPHLTSSPSSHSTNPLPPGEDILGVAEEGQEHGNLINECGPLPVSLAPQRLPEAPAVRDFKWQDIDTGRAKRLELSVCVCVYVKERETQRENLCSTECACLCVSVPVRLGVCVCVCVCGPQRNVAPWI